jgi:hypothetical protein
VPETGKNGILITIEKVEMKALEVTTTLKILWQDFRVSSGGAVSLCITEGQLFVTELSFQ